MRGSKCLQFKLNKTEALEASVLFLLSQLFTCVLTDSPDPQKTKKLKERERENKREGKALISQSTAVCSAQSYTQTHHTHTPPICPHWGVMTHTHIYDLCNQSRRCSTTRRQQITQISPHSSNPKIATT